MMKNVFYFALKALFFLKILSFCLDFLVMLKNCLVKEEKVNFKIDDVTTLETNNCNTHIDQ